MAQELSIVIERPLDDVFAYMDDVEREREWQPNLRKATREPDGPTKVGTRKRYVSEFMSRSVENTYVTTVFEPGRRVVYETTPDSAIKATSEFRWEAVPEGTRVTMSLEATPTGFLRLVPRAVLEGLYREELTTTLDRLKECLEQPA